MDSAALSITPNNVQLMKSWKGIPAQPPTLMTWWCSPMMHSGREITITFVCGFQVWETSQKQFGDYTALLNQIYVYNSIYIINTVKFWKYLWIIMPKVIWINCYGMSVKKSKTFHTPGYWECEIYEVAFKFRAIWSKIVLISCLQKFKIDKS